MAKVMIPMFAARLYTSNVESDDLHDLYTVPVAFRNVDEAEHFIQEAIKDSKVVDFKLKKVCYYDPESGTVVPVNESEDKHEKVQTVQKTDEPAL